MIEIFWKTIKTEVFRDTFVPPRFRFGLETTQKDFTSILFVVRTFIRHEHYGQVPRQFGHFFCHDIEVLGGMKR